VVEGKEGMIELRANDCYIHTYMIDDGIAGGGSDVMVYLEYMHGVLFK
jgi:hypothetical protein